ncbi:MAG: histidine utilization repressor, partial [Fimbriimonadaceae bacterium]|nr:histidine utilization repressor [Alphaproteobacteria bacterium]
MTAVLRYQKVKNYILEHIDREEWSPGDRIPSEAQLVKLVGASRMTVNRAVRELADTGLLERIPGAGTFVAVRRAAAELLEIKNIADQIRENGQKYSVKVHYAGEETAPDDIAALVQIAPGAPVYHTIMVHLADGHPVQVEDRYVNPQADPDYLTVDFSKTTPHQHLMIAAPLSEVEHVIEAIMPDDEIRKLLGVEKNRPCLQIRRRTWTNDLVASIARLTHPGDTYRIGTRFSYRPKGRGRQSFVA